MRRIKFRGLTPSGEWLYGDLVQWHSARRMAMLPQEGDKRKYLSDFEVIPETVGQFIGLTDVNGVDIYEGDIIKLDLYSQYGDTFSVEFSNAAFCLKPKGVYNTERYDLPAIITAKDHAAKRDLCGDDINDFLKHIQVIGNIHQND